MKWCEARGARKKKRAIFATARPVVRRPYFPASFLVLPRSLFFPSSHLIAAPHRTHRALPQPHSIDPHHTDHGKKSK